MLQQILHRKHEFFLKTGTISYIGEIVCFKTIHINKWYAICNQLHYNVHFWATPLNTVAPHLFYISQQMN